jgi:hypothetical protein
MSAAVRTPFELGLENELNIEAQRFRNGWLFKWHGMTYEGGVTDVEDFRGGRIRYGGIKYTHQPQQVFWQAFGRYLMQTVHDTFRKWESATREYPVEVRLNSINGVELALRRFVVTLTGAAMETDRRLRGEGFPRNVEPFDAAGYSSQAGATITQLATAHRAILEDIARRSVTAKTSRRERVENWLTSHKGILSAIGITIAVLTLLLRLFGVI